MRIFQYQWNKMELRRGMLVDENTMLDPRDMKLKDRVWSITPNAIFHDAPVYGTCNSGGGTAGYFLTLG